MWKATAKLPWMTWSTGLGRTGGQYRSLIANHAVCKLKTYPRVFYWLARSGWLVQLQYTLTTNMTVMMRMTRRFRRISKEDFCYDEDGIVCNTLTPYPPPPPPLHPCASLNPYILRY